MNQARGFTLMEMLVSLGLLSLLMLLIGSSVLSARRTIQSATVYGERLDEIRAAQRFLRDALQSRRPLHLEKKSTSKALFEGSTDQLRFVAPVPRGLGGQLKVNQIWVTTNNSAVQLHVAFFDRTSGDSWGTPQVLLEHLSSVHFAYLGRDARQQSTGWLPEWPWPDRPPEAVRIEAEVQGPVVWPTLTVRLPGLRGVAE